MLTRLDCVIIFNLFLCLNFAHFIRIDHLTLSQLVLANRLSVYCLVLAVTVECRFNQIMLIVIVIVILIILLY